MRRALLLACVGSIVFACSAPQGPQGEPGTSGPTGPAGSAGGKGDPGVPGNFGDLSMIDASSPWPGRHVLNKGGKQYSLDATYCGKTASTSANVVSGNLTGYPAAKAQCEQTCATPTAHMCTGEEIVRTLQLGIKLAVENGWYSTGTYVYYPGGNGATSDCQGWTTAAGGAYLGAIWQTNSVGPTLAFCNNSYAIFCCD